MALAISHPHYYTVMAEWSDAFGGIPIYLHEDDRKWVMREHSAIVHWKGDDREIAPGLTLIRCAGHFPGATVMHWAQGARGEGAVFAGDVIAVNLDRASVSFMHSFPNYIPLDAGAVRHIGEVMAPYRFARIFGAFSRRNVMADGRAVFERSVGRYLKAIGAQAIPAHSREGGNTAIDEVQGTVDHRMPVMTKEAALAFESVGRQRVRRRACHAIGGSCEAGCLHPQVPLAQFRGPAKQEKISDMMKQAILDAIKTFAPELIEIRQDIHKHPETRFEEVRTAGLVAEKLRGWGIEVAEGVGKTGVVGTLKGNRPGQRAIGLRADMDALFIEEANEFPHASIVPGKMHACGHDGHTTMLLGAARYLAGARDFAGTVHFIFQPAEEAGTGAPAMIADGLFDRFPCDSVYGLHNSPGLPVGKFATREGPMLAGSDFWGVTFTGTGGHGGSSPHLATDATVVLGYFLLGVQTILPRNLHPTESAALSVGHVSGGAYNSPNVMPSKIVVRGTARYFRTEAQAVIRRRLRQELAKTLAATHGCAPRLDYEPLCPATVNGRRR